MGKAGFDERCFGGGKGSAEERFLQMRSAADSSIGLGRKRDGGESVFYLLAVNKTIH